MDRRNFLMTVVGALVAVALKPFTQRTISHAEAAKLLEPALRKAWEADYTEAPRYLHQTYALEWYMTPEMIEDALRG